MTRIRFQKISVKGKRRWKDESGKWHQETKEFWQTVSPFNINRDGAEKTRLEIMEEVLDERKSWMASQGGKREPGFDKPAPRL